MMPERPLQVAAYAAGASLAAVTLVYVFGPTFFLDDDAAQTSKATRKKGVVGLHNPANDCFINSVLQALAGLPELRVYLIRESHLRTLAGPNVYDALPTEEEDKPAGQEGQEQEGEGDAVAPFTSESKRKVPEWKTLSLQRGLVTIALKEMLDTLNERPIYRKTVSASNFVNSLEQAFRTRINRNQQDAQELLQLLTERLCDEHNAGRKAVERAGKRQVRAKVATIDERKTDSAIGDQNEAVGSTSQDAPRPDILEEKLDGAAPQESADDTGPPFEGKLESHIECTYCHFKPKPTVSSFVTITLHVPHDGRATSLAACFDTMLKVEKIDDFKCARCFIQHAIDTKHAALAKSTNASERQELERHLKLLADCIVADPEKPPVDVPLPDPSTAPLRRIEKHSRISVFPKILAIHLSRSMWDNDSASAKNTTKISFDEMLSLGGLMNQVQYRLLGTVTHKGGHNSGHYETMRRQAIGIGRDPYSTPTSWGTEGAYSVRGSGKGTPASSDVKSTVSLDTGSGSDLRHKTSMSKLTGLAKGRTKKLGSRWWRISDDKIKECSTRDVLDMKREVYMLFYERPTVS